MGQDNDAVVSPQSPVSTFAEIGQMSNKDKQAEHYTHMQTHPLDIPFGFIMAALLCALLLPLAFMVGRDYGPPDDGAAEWKAGAAAMCLQFAAEAGATIDEAMPICQEWAQELEARR